MECWLTALASRSRLQDLALVCALAERAHVRPPQLLTLHAGPGDDLGLVTARTPGDPPGVEAALVAGLAGIGIHAGPAMAGVVVFRFTTFWLPMPIGWLSWQHLRRSGQL